MCSPPQKRMGVVWAEFLSTLVLELIYQRNFNSVEGIGWRSVERPGGELILDMLKQRCLVGVQLISAPFARKGSLLLS